MDLQISLLTPDAKAPTRGTTHAAGYDLYASHSGSIAPRSRSLVRTGIAIGIPTLPPPFKVYASIRSRSGLSIREGIEVGAGVIDADYSNELGVILFNHSDESFFFNKHDRIAQLLLEVHITPEVSIVETIHREESNRVGGFGSTGKNSLEASKK